MVIRSHTLQIVCKDTAKKTIQQIKYAKNGYISAKVHIYSAKQGNKTKIGAL